MTHPSELRISDIPATLDVKNLLDSPITIMGLVTLRASVVTTVDLAKLSPDRRLAVYTTICRAVGAKSLAADVTPLMTPNVVKRELSPAAAQAARDAELAAAGVPGHTIEADPTAEDDGPVRPAASDGEAPPAGSLPGLF